MRVFVDTNVLVYSRDRTDAHKYERAREWLASLWRESAGCVSAQVLNEYYVTVTRKLSAPLAGDDARDDVRDLTRWRPLAIDASLIEAAFEIEQRFGLSYWDSLIVAAARALDADVLLTEDLQDGQRFDGVTVANPFTTEPASLLTG